MLRPFAATDAPDLTRLAGARAIADTTAHIPHPYPAGEAERWIGTLALTFERGETLTLAMTERAGGGLVGATGLRLHPGDARAELGYWVGVPFWGRGYCTEAAAALVRLGFEGLGLHRIYAHHLTRNPASGRVMQKLGMTHEGTLRGHSQKWGVFEDLEIYGLLRDDWALAGGGR